MDDMAGVIIPKSDQLNADDLLTGPRTIKIVDVKIRPGTEQPVSLFYDGDDGKPWKPCKSMSRVLVSAWGADASKYKGRSLTIYCDPKVKWGGMEVGGIRVSHMSDIDSAITMALTVTRANKKPFTVRPLKEPSPPQPSPRQDSPLDGAAVGAATITADEALLIKAGEFASCGTEKYAAWWQGLTAAQRKAIGADKHAEFKTIAANQ